MTALNSAAPVKPGSADVFLRPAAGMTRICVGCPSVLGPKNRSGRCRSCLAQHLNSDPAIVAKRKAAVLARFDNPAVVEEHRQRLARYMRNMPEADRERRRVHGRRMFRELLSNPEVVARSAASRNDPETRRRQGQTHSDTRLPWCPREMRPAYRAMRAKGLSPQEARDVLEPEIPGTAAHGRRIVANHQDAQRIRHERDVAQSY
jgi:hypothetical protein